MAYSSFLETDHLRFKNAALEHGVLENTVLEHRDFSLAPRGPCLWKQTPLVHAWKLNASDLKYLIQCILMGSSEDLNPACLLSL